MAKIKKIKKRSGAVVNFNPDRISNAIYRAAVAVGGRDRVTSERLSAQVVALLEQNSPPGYIPDIEQVQDAVEKVLIENGHARVAKAYILYREERARSRGINAELASKPSGNIPWAKIWHVLDWAASHNVHTIQHYNDRMANGDLPDIIHDSEKAYHEDVESAVEMIAQRKDELRLVIITGPSSSGKTTTTAKISEHLKRLGINLVTLNVDHYFFDLSLHPIDEFGDYDFETPQALDLHLINEHIRALIAGKEVKIPYYDFKIGKRTSNQTPMRLNAGEMILIDSLHGLYPEMTQGIDQQVQFKTYLEPLLQMKTDENEFIQWTDIRLMRRMLRDAAHRSYDPEKTLTHWHYVRSSEMRNIIPYNHTVDYVINSAMPYELSLYKPRLINSFIEWIKKYRDDPLREDAFIRSQCIQKVLAQFTEVNDDTPVPADSVIREFIGGSIYDLH